MAYTVGQSGAANYANTSLTTVTNVVADGGVGGSGEVAVGGSSRAVSTLSISVNTPFVLVNVPALNNYVAGKTDVTITIETGVYVYGITPTLSSNFTPAITTASALEIIGGTSGDTISIINKGYIAGYGGDGNSLSSFTLTCTSYIALFTAPTNGGPGIAVVSSTGCPVTITNTGYIAGGGGGGGGTNDVGSGSSYGGGGGAGGGYSTIAFVPQSSASIVRALPTNPGGLNGIQATTPYGGCFCFNYVALNGGGGGYVFPGGGGIISGNVLGYQTAIGGGSGGSGSAQTGSLQSLTINGGSAYNNAQTTTPSADSYQGGGGGGWGGSGGSAYNLTTLNQVGSVGGAAIVKNGNTVTANGNIYGAIDTTSTSVSYVISASANKLSLTLTTIPGIAAGMDVIIIIAPNVLLYSDDYNTPAFTLELGSPVPPKSVRIILSTGSAIMGAGGTGGAETTINTIGGDAISLGPVFGWGIPTILDCTNGYILGGGGGGGYGNNSTVPTAISYGGGGAGSGNSGSISGNNIAYGATVGTTASGNNGSVVTVGAVKYISGGGGGTIRPSTQSTMPIATTIGPYAGVGGTGGGSGAVNKLLNNTINAMPQGGGFFQNGITIDPDNSTVNSGGSGGGGGGWGASGAKGTRGITTVQGPKGGGKSVRLNATYSPEIYVINSANLAGTISS